LSEPFGLTPAQEEFLEKNIPGFSTETWNICTAAQAGSDRRFVRVQNKTDPALSYMMVVWDSSDNDWPRFLSIANEMSETVRVLPAVFASDARHGLILEEDLGAVRLKDWLEKGAGANDVERMYRRVLDALVGWHGVAVEARWAVAQRRMDEEMFLWESEYFATHCVAEYFGQESLLGSPWEKERRELALEAAALPHVCMHRDFQSENIMVAPDCIRFVDFQGARLGPAEYDLASLLYDPYAAVLDSRLVENLFEYYRSRSACGITWRTFRIAAVQRLLQALGAFSNLSLHKGKDWYRGYIPTGLKRLVAVLKQVDGYEAIRSVACHCLSLVTG